MSSSFGTLFRVSTFGESHGGGVGVVIDGCPPRLPIDLEEIQFDLDRRRPGQSRLVTQRDEADQAEILSGVFEGYTTGTPIAIVVRNKDHNSGAYDHLRDVYRPSHADFTYDAKYGFRNWAGGGRASARETIGRVAAAAIARKLLAHVAGIEVLGWVDQVADIDASVDGSTVDLAQVEGAARFAARLARLRLLAKVLDDVAAALDEALLQLGHLGPRLGGLGGGLLEHPAVARGQRRRHRADDREALRADLRG